MHFSEYVVTERAGTFPDPLGFMRPAGALQDRLFRQFTVQSNHPAYHGMLCAFWDFLVRHAGVARGDAGFGRAFRKLEALWGILNALQGTTILNVRKYERLAQRLAEAGQIRVRQLPESTFTPAGYGTLGHYLQPSIAWGLITRDGAALTARGAALAQATWQRAPQRDGWAALFSDWLGHEPLSHERLQPWRKRLDLLAPATPAEARAWRDIVRDWTDRHPDTAALWRDPVPMQELAQWEQSPAAWQGRYARLHRRYGAALADRLDALHDFERLSAAAQFVFDRRLARLQFHADPAIGAPPLPAGLPDAMVALARRITGTDRSFALFNGLAQARPDDVEQVVIAHHQAHQRAKGVAPYFDDTGLRVTDRLERREFARVLEALAQTGTPGAALDVLQRRAGRDWHFRRCRVYSDWTGLGVGSAA